MVQPISPDEVEAAKAARLPKFVYDAINDLVVLNWDGKESHFTQDDAIDAIVDKANNHKITREVIFKKRWLDFEGAYRADGWKVTYDKPMHNESFKAYYVFSK